MSEAFHSTLPTPQPPTLGGLVTDGSSAPGGHRTASDEATAGARSLLGHAHDHDHGHDHPAHAHGHTPRQAAANALHHTITFPAQPAVGVLMWGAAARLVWAGGLLLVLGVATAWALSGAAA